MVSHRYRISEIEQINITTFTWKNIVNSTHISCYICTSIFNFYINYKTINDIIKFDIWLNDNFFNYFRKHLYFMTSHLRSYYI